MAAVFLSYDHEDAAHIASIACGLEEAGHSVWWDRHIHGGAEFNTEIELAVERADAVVVLWSERSVRSAWVRDEAGEGRDAGKLVPITLDDTKPPMGFRQYQTIKLTKWKGGKATPRIAELLHAIDAVVGLAPARQSTFARAAPQFKRRSIPIAWSTIAAIIAAIFAAGGVLWRPWATEPAALLAISPANSAPASRDYARDLLAQLGQLQSTKPDTLQLVGGDGRKHATLAFEVAGAVEGATARANLVLLDGKTGGLIWSSAFDRPLKEIGDLRQQLGYTAARVLECAVESHSESGAALKPATLKLYLNGCAGMAAGDQQSAARLIPVFRKLIAAAPQFQPGWAKLLLAENEAFAESQNPALRADLRRDVAAARKIDPAIAEAYLAESILLPNDAWSRKIALADRAIASNPDSSVPLAFRSYILGAVGRLNDALEDARRAALLDPVSPHARITYIFALAQIGRTQAALAEVAKAERIWSGSSTIAETKFAIHLRFGDPRVALQMFQSGQLGGDWVGPQNFLKARLSHSPKDIDRAIDDVVGFYRSDRSRLHSVVQTLSILNREDEVLPLLMSVPREDVISLADVTFRPAARKFWRDPASLAYAKRAGLLQYWQSSGKWPDFCREANLPYDCKREAAKLI